MPEQSFGIKKTGAVASFATLLLLTLIVLLPKPLRALPVYSRIYNVPCETCHAIPPKLNSFGMAFQANHFRWPGEQPGRAKGLQALPVSGMVTFSYFHDQIGRITGHDFDYMELFASDGFTLGGPQRPGGYFVDYFAITRGQRAGGLNNAFVSVPVAGKRGQWAVTAGQFSPLTYQYDALNSLTHSLPAAVANSMDGFSFTDPNPGLRMEFFDGRNQESPSGNYASIGVPFEGHLTFNEDSHLYGTTRGAYANAFHRWDEDSVGVFGYTRSGSYLTGLLGTKSLDRERLQLLGAGSIGHDDFGNSDRLSLQADYVLTSSLAFTGRMDSVRGQGQGRSTYPVGAVTYYPFRLKLLRLTAETIQVRGNRSFAAYAFVQF